MRRVTVNLIVNLASFLVLFVLSASGLIIALPHEHGQGEKGILGFGRGQWGDIHLWLGIAFIVLMLVHLILHWDWIKCYLRSAFRRGGQEECRE
jgi:hypothetical protein